MKLTLHHVKNVDLMYGQGNGSGYWEPPVDKARMVVDVTSNEEAFAAMREWVKRNHLGCGNCARDCGTLKDNAGKVVARVSFNGRVWTPEPRPKCTEIVTATRLWEHAHPRGDRC